MHRERGWYMVTLSSPSRIEWVLAHWGHPHDHGITGWFDRYQQPIAGIVAGVIETKVSVPIPNQEDIWNRIPPLSSDATREFIESRYNLIPKSY